MKKLVTSKMLLAALCLGIAAFNAEASVIAVTSLSDLNATESYDWGQLGSDSAIIYDPQIIISSTGSIATVSSVNTLSRVDEGNSWSGNFASGEHLLWTSGQGPDITLGFANPVRGVGAQIQANYWGNFTALVIGLNDTIIGSFTNDGTSNNNSDNSAIFLGILSSDADIKQVIFTLASAPDDTVNDFAIGTVSVSAVPIPSTLWLLGSAFLGLMAARRKLA